MHTIAIIGGGVGGVSVCMQLKDTFIQTGLSAKLIIFEKKNKIGVGLPYDNNESCYRINIHKNLMEPIPNAVGKFSNWIDSTDATLKENLFPPRHYFGQYLQMSVLQMQEEAADQGIKIQFLTNHDVFNINASEGNGYEVFSNSQSGLTVHQVTFVVLSIGHFPTSHYKQFNGQKGYYPNPWDEALFSSFNETDKIGIIGSKLTAIDVALKLNKIKHCGPIFMASPSGLLPTIKATDSNYQLKYLTPLNFRNLLKRHSYLPIQLEHLLNLFTKEFSAYFGHSFNVDKFLRAVKKNSAINRLKYEINQLKINQTNWQKIMAASYQCIVHLWPLLSYSDRTLFRKKYSSIFMTFLCSVPLESASQIYNMLNTKKLHVVGGLERIEYHRSDYCLIFKNGTCISSQHLINATGGGNDLTQVLLLDNLLKNDVLAPHELGGIKVNYNTLQVINNHGKTIDNFYAIGDLIKGECFVIIEIGRIVEQAKIVAKNIVNHM